MLELMDERGEAEDGFAILIGLIFLLPIIIVGWLLIEYHEEIGHLIKELLKLVWKAHMWAGRALLYLVRDLVLQEMWPDDASRTAMRVAVAMWLLVVPALVALLGIVSLVFLPSVGIILYSYYKQFFTGPVPHYRWVQFMKEYHLMIAELRLAWLVKSTESRLWAASQFKRVEQAMSLEPDGRNER